MQKSWSNNRILMVEERKREEGSLRFSCASTNDVECCSEDGICKEIPLLNLVPIKEALDLFTPLSHEVILRYESLRNSLQGLWLLFDQEMQPVNVREEKCLAATTVNLISLTESKLYRRRSIL